jgi:MFS family permease
MSRRNWDEAAGMSAGQPSGTASIAKNGQDQGEGFGCEGKAIGGGRSARRPMTAVAPDSAGAEWRACWPLVLTAGVGMALAAAMNTLLGVMIVPIEREFGWTRAEISSGALIVSVMGLLFAAIAGHAIDRLGARRVGIVVVTMMSGAIMLLATTTDNLWHWWLIWGVFAIAGTATATVWLAPISSKFNKGRGLAIAVTLAGTGLGGALLPVGANYLVEHHGWRAGYLVVGAVFAVLTIPLTYFFWRGTEERVSAGSGGDAAAPSGSTQPAELPGMTIREGLMSRNFLLILSAQTIGSLASMALVVNLIPMLIDARISAGEAAAMAGAQGVAITIGRFVGGWSLDRVSAKWLVAGSTLGSIALPLVLVLAPGWIALAFAVVVFNGLMNSVKYPGMVYLLSRHVGAKSFGALFGVVSTVMSIASGVSPVIANHIFDVTRSYDLVLWAVIPPFVIAAVLFAALGPYPEFEKARGDSA